MIHQSPAPLTFPVTFQLVRRLPSHVWWREAHPAAAEVRAPGCAAGKWRSWRSMAVSPVPGLWWLPSWTIIIVVHPWVILIWLTIITDVDDDDDDDDVWWGWSWLLTQVQGALWEAPVKKQEQILDDSSDLVQILPLRGEGSLQEVKVCKIQDCQEGWRGTLVENLVRVVDFEWFWWQTNVNSMVSCTHSLFTWYTRSLKPDSMRLMIRWNWQFQGHPKNRMGNESNLGP